MTKNFENEKRKRRKKTQTSQYKTIRKSPCDFSLIISLRGSKAVARNIRAKNCLKKKRFCESEQRVEYR